MTAAPPAESKSSASKPAKEKKRKPQPPWLGTLSNTIAAFIAAAIVLLTVLFTNWISERMNQSVPESYRAIKDSVLNPPTDRMLATIVIRGNTAWFFKATGTVKDVTQRAEDIKSFLASVEFTTGAPTWELPNGWKSAGPTGPRFDTITVPTKGDPVEISVTRLAVQTDNQDTYVLRNVQRWLKQMRVETNNSSEIIKFLDEIQLPNEQTAVLVDIAGRQRKSAGGPMARAMASNNSPRPSQPAAPAQFDYEVPQGWLPGETHPMRKVTFRLPNGGEKDEMYVSFFGGGLEANVNRWRDQAGLPSLSGSKFTDSLGSISISGQDGYYVKLIGTGDHEGRSILGAVLPQGDRAWFFKLTAPTDMAEEQEAAFKAFCKSFQLKK